MQDNNDIANKTLNICRKTIRQPIKALNICRTTMTQPKITSNICRKKDDTPKKNENMQESKRTFHEKIGIMQENKSSFMFLEGLRLSKVGIRTAGLLDPCKFKSMNISFKNCIWTARAQGFLDSGRDKYDDTICWIHWRPQWALSKNDVRDVTSASWCDLSFSWRPPHVMWLLRRDVT